MTHYHDEHLGDFASWLALGVSENIKFEADRGLLPLDVAIAAVLLTLVATILEAVRTDPDLWEALRYRLVADAPPDALADQVAIFARQAREALGI